MGDMTDRWQDRIDNDPGRFNATVEKVRTTMQDDATGLPMRPKTKQRIALDDSIKVGRWYELGLALVAEGFIRPGLIDDELRERLQAVLRRTYSDNPASVKRPDVPA